MARGQVVRPLEAWGGAIAVVELAPAPFLGVQRGHHRTERARTAKCWRESTGHDTRCGQFVSTGWGDSEPQPNGVRSCAHGRPSRLRKGAESPSEPHSGSSDLDGLAAQALILRVADHGVVDNFAVDDRVVVTERARRQLLRQRETRRIIIFGGVRYERKQRTRHLVRSCCQWPWAFARTCGAFAPWKPVRSASAGLAWQRAGPPTDFRLLGPVC